MQPFYKIKLDQIIEYNKLTIQREDYKAILAELKIIDNLANSVDSLLQSSQVIGSVLVTYMSKADRRRLST